MASIIKISTEYGSYNIVISTQPRTHNLYVINQFVGNQWYVSPNGSQNGAGTINDPMSLSKALSTSSYARSGDTIYLLEGTYTGSYTSYISGSSGLPITVMSYPNQWAIIDGIGSPTSALDIRGDWVYFKDFEVLNSSTNRGLETPARPFGVYLNLGRYCKCINLVVHDNGNGFYFAPAATNSEIYGCIIYNNGWQEPDRGHGHGIYAQSDASHSITDNIAVNQFGLGIQCFTEVGNLFGFDINGNISYNNGALSTASINRNSNILMGGNSLSRNCRVNNNYMWHPFGNYSNLELGYSIFTENEDITSSYNYIAGGYTFISKWKSVLFTNNILADSTLQYYTSSAIITETVNTNSYFETTPSPPFQYNATSYNFTNWKSVTGFDASSSYTASLPVSTVSFIRPNAYKSGRYHLAVYNWSGSNSSSVDISSVITSGSIIQVKNAANYFGTPVLNVTYSGGPISLPMANLSYATPTGLSFTTGSGTKFNAFVLDTTYAHVTSSGNFYYVALNGSDSGAGTIADPLSITKAFGASSPAVAGDTIYIRSGSYTGYFVINVTGSVSSSITIKQYNKERVVLNGTVNCNNTYQTLIGLEIMNSASVNRVNSESVLGPGINLNSVGCKVINCIIHDTGPPGIWWPSTAGGDATEIYGCLIWGVGMTPTDGAFSGSNRGPNIYAQNASGSRTIENNVVFKSWTEGIKAYGENNYANGFIYKNNVTFGNNLEGYFIDDINNPIDSFVMQGNVSYNDAYNTLGFTEIGHTSMSLSNNTFVVDSLSGYVYQIRAKTWKRFDVTGNTFVELSTAGFPIQDTAVVWQFVTASAYNNFSSHSVNNNEYFGFSNIYGEFYVDAGTRLDFLTMKSLTGWESSGVYHTSSLPTTNSIITTLNRYETGRATITIFNWQNLASASYNLSASGLTEGQTYRIRDVQNWLGNPVLTGSYTQASPIISIPLSSSAVTTLLGGSPSFFSRDPNVHTTPLFNVFILESY